MGISKRNREAVFNKFGGRCAYTGKPLGDDWQVDHMTPAYMYVHGFRSGDKDSTENLLPALKIINHYKRAQDLELFRKYISTLHLRLNKLPKTTKLARTEKRKEYLFKVASYFGVTVDNPFSGVFYFETVTA